MDREIVKNVEPSSQELTEVIQPINRDTVHRICSGQVVLSLAIAVKELVENAIDAGATIIDIRLKEYGSELIEVSDNGKGVVKENFQALTLKHYTSKIKQFDDLQSLSTLGFRGEALSSLCALSDLIILSKHSTAEQATKLTYDRNGKITSETVGAREQGTTVILENLFSTLPVRRKEFLKNLKREFNKMCQLLYAYCLVSKGIKFSCTNTRNKGSKNTVVSTEGLNTVKENIINVFGARQISSLIEIEMVKPEEPVLSEFGLKLVEGENLPFSFEFYVSSVMHGSGRSTNDRQFFYINSRPCDPTKVIKLVNEIYKQYNNSQYPFVYLNIASNTCLVDVNVTPDKRQIFLEKEKVLMATIKASLIEAFKSFPSTFKMQNLELSQNSTLTSFIENSVKCERGLKRSSTDGEVKKGSITERFKKRSKTENDKNSLKSLQLTFSSKDESEDSDVKLNTFIKIASEISENERSKSLINEECSVFKQQKKHECENSNDVKETVVEKKSEADDHITTEHTEGEIKVICKNSNESENIETIYTKYNEKTIPNTDAVLKDEFKTTESTSSVHDDIKRFQEGIVDDDIELIIDSTVRNLSQRKSVTLNVSLDDIKESLKNKNAVDKANKDIKVRFRSKIAPESNKIAEEELQKQISKEDFVKMAIIGQFNLGFIITKLENDLFIIDQHATDEKYNFEQLQATTVMENQILVNPKPLELTAGNECLLIENEEIFKKNGFTFKINKSAPCTKKVSLTSIPLSKNVVFGKDDIDEMLFMLQDSNHTMCRPSRIRAIFASRACRKSVMIGKALSRSDMRRLVDHMGKIEQPWNCPHGRPTMRHLINLDLLETE
ncbi:mismatch repair endonuclease PMS2 [Asbolus verrucosus]|uniref:Mismatch repair endonuclease PMS2 n=1 Tax=Asbolus verrucosus TaxID=1661398 RepID=A0A482VJI7_ASBVE|nr:mismatch repair endonuclease PMS2 [Asbolus verrucosus]